MCDYSSTKGAIISMTKSLAAELAPAGIYVNCVAPGWVADRDVETRVRRPKKRRPDSQLHSPGRAGKPEEIAAPVLFLCTKHAAFVTGEIFNVNGGAVLAG